MSNEHMGLRLIGAFRDVSADGPRQPSLYSVSGLPSEDECLIRYAGGRWLGKPKWDILWHRKNERVPIPAELYDSPEEALKAVAEFKEKGV